MRKTRIYAGDRLLGKFTCDGRTYSWWQYQVLLAKRMALKCTIIAVIIVLVGWVFTAGVILARGTIEPHKVYAEVVVEVPVKEIPPVMKRIAQCESKGLHYWDGQVVLRANTNKTVDTGKYQINSIWNDTATKMGLDLTKEEDNEAFAMYLYETHGTEPWVYSKKCWR